jgi:hypothetical protein
MSQLKVDKIKGTNISDTGPDLTIESAGNFSFDSGTLYIDVANNRIGIGKTNPDRALDVVGSARFTGSITMTGGISASNGTGASGQLLTADGTGGMSWQNAPISLPAQSSATAGAYLRSNGTTAYWFLDPAAQFRTAFNITRGYSMCGYQNSTSWRSANALTHATLSQAFISDVLSFSDAYCAGAQSLSMIAYVFTTSNAWDGTSATVSKMNMNTNTNAGTTSVTSARNRVTIMKRDFRFAYVYGAGDARPDRYNLTNETSALVPNGNPEGGPDNPAGGQGPTYGWTKKSNGYRYDFATEVYSTWTSPPGTDGTNKTLCGRSGDMYWNTGGGYSTSAAMSRRNFDTGVEIQSVGKPGVTGEESFHTGNTAGYMVGMYNGAQNNQGGIIDYTTHVFSFNSSVNASGHGGRASAAGTEFGTVESGYTGV